MQFAGDNVLIAVKEHIFTWISTTFAALQAIREENEAVAAKATRPCPRPPFHQTRRDAIRQ